MAKYVQTLLSLGRVSNLPTVWSNCLAGWCIGQGLHGERLFLLLMGATFLYLGGMFLNDAFDAQYDRQHRPERPIPTGAMAVSLDNELVDACQNGCPDRKDDVEKRDNLAMSTNFLLAFGGAAAVAGSVILIVVHTKKEKKTKDVANFSISPLIGPYVTGATFEWRF